jgi:hypothetical protein
VAYRCLLAVSMGAVPDMDAWLTIPTEHDSVRNDAVTQDSVNKAETVRTRPSRIGKHALLAAINAHS